MASKFLKIANKEEWRSLLNRALFKTFFHSLEWEDFLESQFKWLKFERYLWPVKDGQALLSFASAGGKKLVSHPFCEYGGPLPLVSRINGREFQGDLFEEFKTPFKISFHPKVLDYFEGMEFPENQRETYLFENLHLKTEQDIWQMMDRNRHRAIKSAQDRGFKIQKCKNLEELKTLYDFYVENIKKHKAIPYPFAFFEFFFNSPQAEVLMADKGGNIFLFYDNIVHSFLCGFDNISKKDDIHSLLLWEEIRGTGKRGYSVFDLGATRKDSSVRDFKERWGAVPYPIYELKNYSGESGLRTSKLRDIFGLLPVFLIKILSPYLLRYKL